MHVSHYPQHLVHERVPAESAASLRAISRDDIQDSWREACLHRQLSKAQRCQHCLLCRLQAAGQVSVQNAGTTSRWIRNSCSAASVLCSADCR